MKKTFFTIALSLILSIIIQAQTSSFDLIKNNYTKGRIVLDKHISKYFKSKAVSWNWDSLVSYDTLNLSKKTIRTYNPLGFVLTETVYKWESGIWKNSSRKSLTYDFNMRITSILYQSWNNNVWENSNKYTLTYNTNGYLSTEISENWQSNAWVNGQKTVFTYDANGNVLTEIFAYWSNTSWDDNSKTTYTYNASGNVLTILFQLWMNNNWENDSKYTYTYNTNGSANSYLFEMWQGSWVNDNKLSYTYDVNGNYTMWLVESWQNNAWVNSNKYNFTNDANGNRLTETFETWNNNVWEFYTKLTYTYDANGNSITGKHQIWDNNTWILNDGSLDVFSDKEIVYTQYATRYTANWISFTTGIKENNEVAAFNIFPNPSNDIITIDCENFINDNLNISIYNVTGELVRSEFLKQNHQQMNISDLNNGIYFIEIKFKGGSKKQKLIIQR